MADQDSVPIPRKGFHMESMDGEAVIYRHIARKAIYLNESAAVVWQLCDGNRSIREIVDMLAEAYPGARDELSVDVMEAVERLEREGALRIKPTGSN